MMIAKEKFVTINKWAVFVAIFVYLIGVFTPLKYLQPGTAVCIFRRFSLPVPQRLSCPEAARCRPSVDDAVLVTIFTATCSADRGQRQSAAVSADAADLPDTLRYAGDRLIRRKDAEKTATENHRRPHCCPEQHFYDLGIGHLILLYQGHAARHAVLGNVSCDHGSDLSRVSSAALSAAGFAPMRPCRTRLLKNMTYKRPIDNLPKAIEAQSSYCLHEYQRQGRCARAPVSGNTAAVMVPHVLC